MREPAGTGGVVPSAIRAQFDQAHAQRIVAITYEGDRGLIALQAYQAYVREITNQQKRRAGKNASTSSPALRTRRPILQV